MIVVEAIFAGRELEKLEAEAKRRGLSLDDTASQLTREEIQKKHANAGHQISKNNVKAFLRKQ